MITSPDQHVILSSLGWVDGDALWCLDARRGTAEVLPMASGARWLSLATRPGSPRFVVAHHFDGSRFELTVRRFAAPDVVLARARLGADGQSLEGDPEAWEGVPRIHAEHLAFAPWEDFVLCRPQPERGTVEVQRLAWYDGTYDKLYQGIVDAVEVPGEEAAWVAVQRSSELVLHDLASGQRKGSVELAGRHGNPRLRLRRGGRELWATDYDTLLVVDPVRRRVLRRVRLQGAASGTRQFIGEYAFGPGEASCAVARPASGDALRLDPATLELTGVARLGRQPLEVALLPGEAVVARDWQSGDLLSGTWVP